MSYLTEKLIEFRVRMEVVDKDLMCKKVSSNKYINTKGPFRMINLKRYLLIVDKGWVGVSRKHP